MTYFFILGKNPRLSVAEIKAVIKNGDFKYKLPNVLFVETKKEFDVKILNKKLGGTIKIGEVIGRIKNLDELKSLVKKELSQKEGKIYFGISNYSNYSARDIKQTAMEIKKELKQTNSVRWVTSKEKILSSVIVKTNNLLDKGMEICLFDDGVVGKTLIVQEFEELEKRDYGKPARDILRGMIPPKLAKIMINLSETNLENKILDPFCGAGTILMEEIIMGYKNLMGSDIDKVAVSQTKENLDWVKKIWKLNPQIKLFQSDAKNLSKKLKPNSVDAIITEPYLGPLLKESSKPNEIKKIINELEILYFNSFKDWKNILKKNGKIVIVIPILKNHKLNLLKKLEKIGYKKIQKDDLIYKRPNQKVARSIEIFQRM